MPRDYKTIDDLLDLLGGATMPHIGVVPPRAVHGKRGTATAHADAGWGTACCTHGHPFTPENTRTETDGYKTCLYCETFYKRGMLPPDGDPAARRRVVRRHNMRKRHGIAVELYDAISGAQKGLCAACGGPPKAKANLEVLKAENGSNARPGPTQPVLLCHRCMSAANLVRRNATLLRAIADLLPV